MTRQGVWDLNEVRDKYLEGLWEQSYTIWAMGQGNKGEMLNNENGDNASRSSPTQLGGTLTNGWATVRSGSYGSFMAARGNGELWVCGANNYGQLGLNDQGTGDSGSTYRSSPAQLPGTNWEMAECYYTTTIAVKTDGTMWAWGQMNNGSLGQNQSWSAGPQTGVKGYSSPVQIGTDTTWTSNYQAGNTVGAIKTDGTLWTWGSNTDGVLGHDQPSNPGQRSSPAQVGTETTWAQCAIGGGFMLGRKTDGSLWSWGSNQDGGPLGQNGGPALSSPKRVGTETTWADIAGCAPAMAAGIKTDGTLWTWGGNEQASLGHNNKTNYSSPRQVGTDTDWKFVWGGGADGGHHFFATKTDGTLWNWGRGSYGALGHNSTAGFSSPIQLGTETVYGGLNKKQIGVNDRSCYIMKPLLTPSQL